MNAQSGPGGAGVMEGMVLAAYNRPLELRELPVPEPGPGEVLLRVTHCGICGTDLKIVTGQLPEVITLPHVPGHEIAGEVASVGPGVTGLEPGQRGVVYPYLSCGDCELCRGGRENICFRVRRLGFELPGGFARYVKLPAYNFCRTGGAVPPGEMSVLADAAATPYHALKTVGRLAPGQRLLIVGAGGLGLFAVQVARLMGARVAAADLRPGALQAAQSFGAELLVDPGHSDPRRAVLDWTRGRGVDLVLEGVGVEATFRWSIACLKRGGRLVIMGYDPVNPLPLGAKEMHYNEWTVAGTRLAPKQELVEVIELVEQGALRSVATRRRRLREANEALRELADGDRVGRIVLEVG